MIHIFVYTGVDVEYLGISWQIHPLFIVDKLFAWRRRRPPDITWGATWRQHPDECNGVVKGGSDRQLRYRGRTLQLPAEISEPANIDGKLFKRRSFD